VAAGCKTPSHNSLPPANNYSEPPRDPQGYPEVVGNHLIIIRTPLAEYSLLPIIIQWRPIIIYRAKMFPEPDSGLIGIN